MNALSIDCAVSELTVAAKKDRQTVKLSLDIGMKQSEKILPAIDYVMKESGLTPSDLDYTACTLGPGTFTGLRLGLSALKALTLANNTPLYAVPSLDLYAHPYKSSNEIVLSVLESKEDEFFHALTDASGGMEFIKSLVSEYIRLTNVIIKDKTNIININDNPDISEFTNEFINVEKTPDAGGLYNKIATQMTGDLSKIKPCRILNFKMSSNKLREVARKYNITVTTYLLCIMFIACKSACEIYDGEFSIQVPVNMRKFYPSKTLRNFSMYCGIRLPISKIQDINSISNEVVEQLTSKSSKEEMHKMLYGTKKLISNIKLIPLVIKQPIAKFISGIIGDLAFTSTLSNIGIINLPEEYKDYIEDMEFVLNTSTKNRATCGLVTYNDVATLSITKLTKDPSFETRIYDLLFKDGIDITVEGSEIYDY